MRKHHHGDSEFICRLLAQFSSTDIHQEPTICPELEEGSRKTSARNPSLLEVSYLVKKTHPTIG